MPTQWLDDDERENRVGERERREESASEKKRRARRLRKVRHYRGQESAMRETEKERGRERERFPFGATAKENLSLSRGHRDARYSDIGRQRVTPRHTVFAHTQHSFQRLHFPAAIQPIKQMRQVHCRFALSSHGISRTV